ncbi:unnamed protein product [Closterium sp. Yama58-4]|nr:unnamed protein product [Closterium sp. Yama58-4]
MAVEVEEVAEEVVAGVLAGVVASVAAAEAVAAEGVAAAVAAAAAAGAALATAVAVGVEALALRGASGSSGRCPYVIRTGDRKGQTCGKFHTQHRCFSRLDDAWREEMGEEMERPRWHELLRAVLMVSVTCVCRPTQA